MKQNDVPPPIFLAPTDEAAIVYARHDGPALIGEGTASFETKLLISTRN